MANLGEFEPKKKKKKELRVPVFAGVEILQEKGYFRHRVSQETGYFSLASS